MVLEDNDLPFVLRFEAIVTEEQNRQFIPYPSCLETATSIEPWYMYSSLSFLTTEQKEVACRNTVDQMELLKRNKLEIRGWGEGQGRGTTN